MKAKKASLISKIIAVMWIIAAHIVLLYLLGNGRVTADDVKIMSPVINAVGFAVMGIFGTVDLNLLAEKFATNKE